MASITLTATAQQAAAVQHDVGVALNLGRDATIVEIQQYLRNDLEALHRQVKINETVAAIVVDPLNLT